MTNNLITDGQKYAVVKLFGTFSDNRPMRLWILSQWIGRKIESSSELTLNEWQIIRNFAYPNWTKNDWSISASFTSKGLEYKRRYEKEILGQMDLF